MKNCLQVKQGAEWRMTFAHGRRGNKQQTSRGSHMEAALANGGWDKNFAMFFFAEPIFEKRRQPKMNFFCVFSRFPGIHFRSLGHWSQGRASRCSLPTPDVQTVRPLCYHSTGLHMCLLLAAMGFIYLASAIMFTRHLHYHAGAIGSPQPWPLCYHATRSWLTSGTDGTTCMCSWCTQ